MEKGNGDRFGGKELGYLPNVKLSSRALCHLYYPLYLQLLSPTLLPYCALPFPPFLCHISLTLCLPFTFYPHPLIPSYDPKVHYAPALHSTSTLSHQLTTIPVSHSPHQQLYTNPQCVHNYLYSTSYPSLLTHPSYETPANCLPPLSILASDNSKPPQHILPHNYFPESHSTLPYLLTLLQNSP